MSFRTPARLTRVATQFDIQTVAVEPGETLPYDKEQWRDALVMVRSGEITLEMTCGRPFLFRQGDVLWLAELPIASLQNRGRTPVVLVSAARHTEMQ